MQDYRKLDVWTKSHELALDVHRATTMRSRAAEAEDGAKEGVGGPRVGGAAGDSGAAGVGGAAGPEGAAEIRADVRRAARRVPVLIVLGCDAETAAAFAEAMREAATSVDELAYRLRFARDAGVLEGVPYAKLEARAIQLRAMLGALNRTVRLKLGAAGRPQVTTAPRRAAATPSTEAQAAVSRGLRAVRDDGSSRPRSHPRSTS